MARADSTVRVNIIGDARSLSGALKQGEKDAGGFGSKIKGLGLALGAAFTVDKVLDFTQTALGEYDRLGDATARLREQLGGLSEPLIGAADKFTALGGSTQDVIELEARLADLGTAAGIVDEKLAPMAQTSAETALALSLLGNADAATILDQIGKAAGGSDKPLKELGISLTDTEVQARALADTGKTSAAALTDNELAAARLELVLAKLAPRVAEVTTGTADLEKNQSALQARWETLTGKIGGAIEGPLNDLLAWILSGIDGLGMLDVAVGIVERGVRDLLTPVARAIDELRKLVDLLQTVASIAGNPLGTGAGLVNRAAGAAAGNSVQNPDRIPSATATVIVQGGSPEEIQRAVEKAVATINRHAGAI